jgi:tetratricopeptide (TPR) repeat protein
LAQAIEVLNEWAVDVPDNGVNFQSYLLRGKAEGEAGDWEKAKADFAKAQAEKAPNWVQYQARYQTVVANLRGGDVAGAQEQMNAFRRWIPKDNAEAVISADMLAYRVAWTVASAKIDATERRRAQQAALQNVAGIIQRDGRFRDLVYEQLAAQVPEGTDVKTLYPIQQLALARWYSENQRGDTAESRSALTRALAAATAAKENAAGTTADKNEATFLLGVCQALLGNLKEAVGFEVEFATALPKDPRAKQMIDLALQQIGELRSAAATQPGTAGMIGGLTPEMRALATKTLEISTGTFGDKQWLYAQGRMMEEAGKTAEAAKVYEKVGAEDRNYLEARYRLVALATERFSQLEGKGSAAEQKAAATDLFAACAKFSDLLDHPPASAAAETVKAAQAYRYNVWLIEAATALTPAVRNTEVALDRLSKLDAAKEKLSETQRGTVLRYRIQAYQLAGQNEKARQVIQEYSKTGAEALGDIRSLALATVDEIDKTADAAETKRLASYVVELLNPIIEAATAEGNGGGGAKKDNAFEYRLIQAEMMVKAGQYKEAQTLASALQVEKREDIRAYMTEARAMFAQAKAGGGAGNDATLFAKSQDYFTRILARLAPGSEAFWESWLRIVESMEAQKGNGASAEIKTRLGDLKAVYGTKFGGEKCREEFLRLARKYGVE